MVLSPVAAGLFMVSTVKAVFNKVVDLIRTLLVIYHLNLFDGTAFGRGRPLLTHQDCPSGVLETTA